MTLFEHIKSGGKIEPGDKISVINYIRDGNLEIVARPGQIGKLITDVLSGEIIRIKIDGIQRPINYAPAKSLKLL